MRQRLSPRTRISLRDMLFSSIQSRNRAAARWRCPPIASDASPAGRKDRWEQLTNAGFDCVVRHTAGQHRMQLSDQVGHNARMSQTVAEHVHAEQATEGRWAARRQFMDSCPMKGGNASAWKVEEETASDRPGRARLPSVKSRRQPTAGSSDRLPGPRPCTSSSYRARTPQ